MRESIVAEPPGLSSTLARDRDDAGIERDAPAREPGAIVLGETVTAERRPFAALGLVVDEWRALAARALEPNIFYEPAFALAAAPVFAADGGAVLVWSRARAPGPPRRLIGLFPVAEQRRRYGFSWPMLCGWTHPYAPLGVPLVDRDAADAAIAAFLDYVSGDRAGAKILLLPLIAQDRPFALALDRVIARRGGRVALFAPHQRAMLAPGDDRARYLDHAIGRKRRKELRRQRRRLEDSAAVTLATAVSRDAVGAALGEFLALEARGWKGRRGTAALGRAGITRFMETAITGLAADGMARVDRLLVGGRTVAAAITLRSANAAWFFKIAYDETLARASPGVQLTLDITTALLADAGIARVDSCASENHTMIDHLWRERLALADRLVAIGPGHAGTFALVCRLERLRGGAIAMAKRVRDIWQDAWPAPRHRR